MKGTTLIGICLIIALQSCKPTDKPIQKSWLGQPIDFSQIREVTNTYQMIDSTGSKVGSMVFSSFFEDGYLISRDTSQFDDGSVYETAQMTFDTSTFKMKALQLDLKTPKAALDIDFEIRNSNVLGTYQISRDTSKNVFPIDSVFDATIFREEIYMLAQTLNLQAFDTLSFTALVPTNLSISTASLAHVDTETIETYKGTQACDVLMLKTDGKMPVNKIWITQQTPRTIVKFHVPAAKLTIELKSQQENIRKPLTK